ncbi:MAG: metallophosphoesterase family protein [Flavobacteriales bacterium]
MNIVLLSDIHSNKYALRAVLSDVAKEDFDFIFLLGDIFGYYPWAADTYDLLFPFLEKIRAVKGNHDSLLLTSTGPSPEPSYWKAAQQNRIELLSQKTEALTWLSNLDFKLQFMMLGNKITLVHGTPDEPESGRYYPDNSNTYPWFPQANEWIFGGHTHYPLLRKFESGGMFINPGSVGQPREGEPSAKWAIANLKSSEVLFRKSGYDHLSAMRELTELSWDDRAIKALNKTKPGTL